MRYAALSCFLTLFYQKTLLHDEIWIPLAPVDWYSSLSSVTCFGNKMFDVISKQIGLLWLSLFIKLIGYFPFWSALPMHLNKTVNACLIYSLLYTPYNSKLYYYMNNLFVYKNENYSLQLCVFKCDQRIPNLTLIPTINTRIKYANIFTWIHIDRSEKRYIVENNDICFYAEITCWYTYVFDYILT